MISTDVYCICTASQFCWKTTTLFNKTHTNLGKLAVDLFYFLIYTQGERLSFAFLLLLPRKFLIKVKLQMT
jgi:hypothetical protein